MEKKLLNKKRKAQEDGNDQLFASSCHNLGNFYHETGQYDKALEEYKAEAEKWKSLKIRMKYGIAHRMIGEIMLMLGDVQESLKHEHQYLKIALEENDDIEVQRAYATIGRVFLFKGQNLTYKECVAERQKALKEAERAFLKSLTICRDKLSGKISNTELQDMMARLYLNLSVTKENCSDEIEKSLEYMTKAIAICKSHDLYELLHQCYMSTGLLYEMKKKDIANSLRYLNLALDMAQRLEARTAKTCETLLAKSEVLIKSGDYQSAKQTLHKAYKMKTPIEVDRETIEQKLKVVAALCYTEDSLITANSSDHRRKKELYEKMGDGSCKLENYDKALIYYQKMLENAEISGDSGKDLIPIYVSLYQTYRDNQDFQKALEYSWKEYELCKEVPREAFLTLMNIAELSDLSGMGFWDVEKLYQRARKEAERSKDKKSEALVVGKLIKIQKKHGMEAQAEFLTKEAQLSCLDINSETLDDEDNGSCDDNNTPSIGDDICLDDLSDSGSEEDADIPPAVEDARPVRRKRVTNVIKRNNKGETQLHQACISGNVTLTRRLLDQGHPVNVRDHAGWLPLHEACIHGHREIVEMLLEKSCATINDRGGTSCDGITPIHDASSNGHLDIVEFLLDKGANATVRTDCGDTPLDTLKVWRESTKLDPADISLYDTLLQRLTKLMQKAGMTPKEKPTFIRRVSPLMGSESPPRTFSPSPEKSSLLYKSVIDNLRKKPSVDDARENLMISKKRSAYLTGNEVGDDWLEDDLLPNKKRRKFLKESHYVQPKVGRSKSSVKSSEVNSDDIEEIDDSPENSREIPLSNGSKSIKSVQSSLLNAGFSRQQIDLTDVMNVSPAKSSKSSTGQSRSIPVVPVVVPAVVQNMITIKVKIDDQLIVVPVNTQELSSLQMKWLADKAAKRYYNLHGRLPEMLLTTDDGALYDDQDPISLIMNNDQYLVHSRINRWNVLSLAESYKDVTKQMELRENVKISHVLNIAENCNELNLGKMFLRATDVRPMFKAIQHHVNLGTIDLRNNNFGDEGLVYLCQSLTSLKHLAVLNLSGNHLTENGLLRLANVLQDSAEVLLPELRDCSFSHNELGNGGRKYLSVICEKLPKLRILHFSQCDFTELGDYSFAFERLDSLDLSFNDFRTADELRSLWRSLDVTKIEYLNLSFSVQKPGLGIFLCNFFQSGFPKYLRELHLQHCHLTDPDFWNILKSLTGNDINIIKMDENPLTILSLQHLLTTNLTVKMVSFLGCDSILENVSALEELSPGLQGDYHPETITLTDRSTDARVVEHLKKVWASCWSNRHPTVERKKNKIILSISSN
ncbi:Tonsoku-like protein [Sergentomyia squamirostris]